MIDSNLISVFLTCRSIMPQMMRQCEGHIVNIAARVGLDGAANVVAYTAAKAGVIGFSKALGLELKPYHVKASVICPSPGYKNAPGRDPGFCCGENDSSRKRGTISSIARRQPGHDD